MSSLNQVNIIGRLGRDPETRNLPGGEIVTSFSVATSETWKDKTTNEKRENVEWHRVSTFGRLAEIAGQYLQKGSLVFIQGKLLTRKYTDKDGIEKTSTEIRGKEMLLLSTKNDGQAAAQKPASQAANDFEQDIPF